MTGASTAFRLMGWMLCLVFLASGCASHERRVRVMTYNIHHGTDAVEQMTLSDVADLRLPGRRVHGSYRIITIARVKRMLPASRV